MQLGGTQSVCFCGRIDGSDMISCDDCDQWVHFTCVNLSKGEASLIEQYFCHEGCAGSGPKKKIVYKSANKIKNEARAVSFHLLAAEIARVETEVNTLKATLESLQAPAEPIVPSDDWLLETVKEIKFNHQWTDNYIATNAKLPGGERALYSWMSGRSVDKLGSFQQKVRVWLMTVLKNKSPTAASRKANKKTDRRTPKAADSRRQSTQSNKRSSTKGTNKKKRSTPSSGGGGGKRAKTAAAAGTCQECGNANMLLSCVGCGVSYHPGCLVPPIDPTKFLTGRAWKCPACIYN